MKVGVVNHWRLNGIKISSMRARSKEANEPRCGGEIENGDFDKGKDANVGLFGTCLLLRYKATGLSKNLERGAEIRDLQQKNNFESVTWRPTVCYFSLRLLSVRDK